MISNYVFQPTPSGLRPSARLNTALGVLVTYSAAESEAIGLCIALEAVGDIANHALLELTDVSSFPGEAEVRFPSRVYQQLFLARLLDFAKEGGDASLTGVNGSCLSVLQAACESRCFDQNNSVSSLKESTAALDDWLAAKTPLKLWLPSLDIEAILNVPRIEFLCISGNQAKHNLSRLTGLSKRIESLLRDHGHDVALEQVPLALDDFREHLQEDYFSYYGTWLVELLNNVRWSLQEYLLPTFKASFKRVPDDDVRYTYEYPAAIANPVPRAWFWRLMNNVRSGPYLKRFEGAHYLKRQVRG